MSLPPHLRWAFVSQIQDPQVKSMALSSRNLMLRNLYWRRQGGDNSRRLPIPDVRFSREGGSIRITEFGEWHNPLNGDGYF
jgi:hypothetical protein